MITYKKWGEYEGKDIFLFTLENGKGTRVMLTNFGCALTGAVYHETDVILGFEKSDDHVAQSCFLGVTVGRYANRIREGRFLLDGTEYHVSRNLGAHHLHGGYKGFDKVLWDVESIAPEANKVRFSYVSRDGEEGFPGNLMVKITYSLNDFDEIIVDFEAFSDKLTVINLSNHAYFNLSGHDSGTIENQRIKIYGDAFLESDPDCVPTGKVLPVEGTPFDFREFRKIGERIGADDIQLKYGGGYDHNFILNKDFKEQTSWADNEETGPDTTGKGLAGPDTTGKGLALAAEAASDETGIKLQVLTTLPGIQFYSGNNLKENNMGKGGAVYFPRSGFCLEAQFYPDAINHPEFPQPVLLPGQEYRHTTIYRFQSHG